MALIISENDGERIIAKWQFLIPYFHNHHHTKYLKLANMMVLQIKGAASPQMRKRIVECRTVNPTGRVNVSKDFQQEIFNGIFKGKVFMFWIMNWFDAINPKLCIFQSIV